MFKRFVKVTKSINRRVGDKEYAKYIITIPQKLMNELEWSDKTSLSMRIEPKSNPKRLVIEKE